MQTQNQSAEWLAKGNLEEMTRINDRLSQGHDSLFEFTYVSIYVYWTLFFSSWWGTEYIMRNAGLEEAQAGIKIVGRNINNLRYADDTTLMAESEEELKNLLRKVKEESEKVGLKLNIQKTKIMASGPIT